MNEGVVPFRYGFAGDYWPGIDLAHGSTLGVSKDMYVSSRSEVARKRLEEVEERALELADGRTERAIRKEREYIVGRISISAADTLASARAQAMQGRLAAPHGKGGKSKKGPAAYASPPSAEAAGRADAHAHHADAHADRHADVRQVETKFQLQDESSSCL